MTDPTKPLGYLVHKNTTKVIEVNPKKDKNIFYDGIIERIRKAPRFVFEKVKKLYRFIRFLIRD